jgi:guanosine-3',5'-bis(diphosphate) 3'-pyrophosphohydrolase
MRTWLEKAKTFVQEKFQGVRVKKDPVAHALEVFRILKEEFGIADTEVPTAGILHDVLEDTRTTVDEVRMTFSERIAALVKAVSHEQGHGYDREAFYEQLKSIPVEAKWIKLADGLANLEWMLERLKAGQPVFRSHEPYLRHIRLFLGSCLDPSLLPGGKKAVDLCHQIERLEHQMLREDDLVVIGDI